MVTVIKTGHSIHRIFNYNENKVRVGVAECIGAGNYPIDSDKMSLSMKLSIKQLMLIKDSQGSIFRDLGL